MDNYLNLAFIGCGAIAQNKHIPLSKNNPCVNIKYLFNRNPEKAYYCKNHFHASNAQVVGDADDIFADSEIDLVFISTPNDAHHDYAIRALNAGKHVICEKPMAIDYSKAQKMYDAAVKSGKLLHISYQNRYSTQALQAKELIENGGLSSIYYAKAYAIRRRALPTWGRSIQKSTQGGGALIDIGSHALDLAMWLIDDFEPLYVVGSTSNLIARTGSCANYWGEWDTGDIDIEDFATGYIRMKSGLTLTVDASYAMNVVNEKEASVDIFGACGGLQLRQNESVKYVYESGSQMLLSEIIHQKDRHSHYCEDYSLSPSEREHKAVISSLLNGTWSNKGALQALQVSKVIDAIYCSAKNNKPIYFDI